MESLKNSKKWALLIIAVFLLSCGSRKAEVEKLKTEIRQQRELVLTLQNNIQSNVRIIKVANKQTVEPIDESEISTFNGVSFTNARITTEQTESDSTASLNNRSRKEMQLNEDSEIKTTEKTKNTESKKPNPWLWLSIVFVIALVLWLKPWK